MSKRRLDLVLTELENLPSREKARTLIMSGKVKVNNKIVDKPGFMVSTNDLIEVKKK